MEATPETLPTPTLSEPEALIDPELAEIVAVPALPLLANPVLPIVATEIGDDVQMTEFVRIWVLPSLYVPIAEYC